ncbi:MAG: hypothetical protein JWO73_709 [Candidatus Taylorbacteria bacterium]|nr:hypothetical protein [Candidatus Taylorbacteria bacterium]
MNYSTTPFPNNFEQIIILRIRKAEKSACIRRSICSGSISIISLSAAVFSFASVKDTLSQSGAFEYVSAALSDGTGALDYWKELTLSIVDSLPIFGIAILLGVFCVFLWSGARAIKNTTVALAA